MPSSKAQNIYATIFFSYFIYLQWWLKQQTSNVKKKFHPETVTNRSNTVIYCNCNLFFVDVMTCRRFHTSSVATNWYFIKFFLAPPPLPPEKTLGHYFFYLHVIPKICQIHSLFKDLIFYDLSNLWRCGGGRVDGSPAEVRPAVEVSHQPRTRRIRPPSPGLHNVGSVFYKTFVKLTLPP